MQGVWVVETEEEVFLNNYIKKEVKFTGSNFDFFFILHIKIILLFNCGCHSPPSFNKKQN
jgi:hypothetical protein